MSDIEIEIDGKKLTAKPNAMVIQVADEAGIYIPRFCYHKHLSIAANCRMCLVEVEKAPKTLPACATPVMAGMKVFTKSPKALASQKAVMEFLLINHPLDCPICDQGGECELQDLAMGFGSPNSYYHEGKRSVADQDIGPLIQTDMTRCIQCTRCVRFGAEIAGMPELGATGRGEDMEIGTYMEHSMKSEVSGNVIDICPVGALTSKPFRFRARAWELEQRPTIAAHDSVGANLYAHTRNGVVMRMVPRENFAVNQTWISDRDRFSYEGLYHADRITKPMIKKQGKWHETDWQSALEFAAVNLQKTISTHGAEQLGALASPNSTLEEFYLLQKIMRALGTSNIDYRLRQCDFADDAAINTFPGLGMTFAELEECDTILLLGCNLQKEAPSAFLRVRNATKRGAEVLVLNPINYLMSFPVVEKHIATPDQLLVSLAGIAKLTGADLDVTTTVEHQTFANYLQRGKKVAIVVGSLAMNDVQASTFRALAALIAKQTHGTLCLLTEGANAAGAWLAGAIPKNGLNAKTMLTENRRAYVLLNVEPELDCANPALAMNALRQAEFVVSLSLFKNAVLDEYANVILPIAPFTETSGTFVNAAGDWQRFTGVANAYGESRPAWKILRVLGNLLHLEGFDHASSEDVHQEVKFATAKLDNAAHEFTLTNKQFKFTTSESLYRIGAIPLYAVDSLVRRSQSLQTAQAVLENETGSVHMHPILAKHMQLQNGMEVTVKQINGSARLPVAFDDRLPERGVLIAGGIAATSSLSDLFGPVEIEK